MNNLLSFATTAQDYSPFGKKFHLREQSAFSWLAAVPPSRGSSIRIYLCWENAGDRLSKPIRIEGIEFHPVLDQQQDVLHGKYDNMLFSNDIGIGSSSSNGIRAATNFADATKEASSSSSSPSLSTSSSSSFSSSSSSSSSPRRGMVRSHSDSDLYLLSTDKFVSANQGHHWALSHANLEMTKISPTCWFVELPCLPTASSSFSASSSSSPLSWKCSDRSSRFVHPGGFGMLKFHVTQAVKPVRSHHHAQQQQQQQHFQASNIDLLINTHDPLSKVVFVGVREISLPPPPPKKGKSSKAAAATGGPSFNMQAECDWLTHCYASFLSAIWNAPAAPDAAAQVPHFIGDDPVLQQRISSSIAKIYNQTWEHGLLHWVVRSWCAKKMGAADATSIMERGLDLFVHQSLLSSGNGTLKWEDFLRIWSIAGQFSSLPKSLYGCVRPILVNTSAPIFRPLQKQKQLVREPHQQQSQLSAWIYQWYSHRKSVEWLADGSHSIYRFAKLGLSVLFFRDIGATITRYEFLKMLPIMAKMNIIGAEVARSLRNFIKRRRQQGEILPPSIYHWVNTSILNEATNTRFAINAGRIDAELQNLDAAYRMMEECIKQLQVIRLKDPATELMRLVEEATAVTKLLQNAVEHGEKTAAASLQLSVQNITQAIGHLRDMEAIHDKFVLEAMDLKKPQTDRPPLPASVYQHQYNKAEPDAIPLTPSKGAETAAAAAASSSSSLKPKSKNMHQRWPQQQQQQQQHEQHKQHKQHKRHRAIGFDWAQKALMGRPGIFSDDREVHQQHHHHQESPSRGPNTSFTASSYFATSSIAPRTARRSSSAFSVETFSMLELADGTLLIADAFDCVLKMVFPNLNRVVPLTVPPRQNGEGSHDDQYRHNAQNQVPLASITLRGPRGMSLEEETGSILLLDVQDKTTRIYRISSDLNMTEEIQYGYQKTFLQPSCIASVSKTCFLVGDKGARCIQRLDKNGMAATYNSNFWTTMSLFSSAGSLEDRVDSPECMIRCMDGSIVFTDSKMHLVKRISADLSTLTTVSGVPGRAGHIDGGKKSQYNHPTGVVELRNRTLLVCDQQNDCIRAIAADAGTVTTLHLRSNAQESTALSSTDLMFGEDFFMMEMAAAAAASRYNSSSRFLDQRGITLPSWSNADELRRIKDPNRLLVLRSGLMLCFEANSCKLRKLEFEDKDYFAKADSKLSASHAILRAVKSAIRRTRYLRALQPIRSDMQLMVAETSKCRESLQLCCHQLEIAYSFVEDARQLVRCRLYERELTARRILGTPAKDDSRPEIDEAEVFGLVLAAPSITMVVPILQQAVWSKEILAGIKQGLTVLIQGYSWTENLDEINQELITLARGARLHGAALFQGELVCAIFKSKTFQPPVCFGALELVDAVLLHPSIPNDMRGPMSPTDVSEEQQRQHHNNASSSSSLSPSLSPSLSYSSSLSSSFSSSSSLEEAQHAIVSWLNKVVTPTSFRGPFGLQLKEIMMQWNKVQQSLTSPNSKQFQCASQASLDKVLGRNGALSCLISAHFDSICRKAQLRALRSVLAVSQIKGAMPTLLFENLLTSLKKIIQSSPNCNADIFQALVPNHDTTKEPCTCDGQFFCRWCNKYNDPTRGLADNQTDNGHRGHQCVYCCREQGVSNDKPQCLLIGNGNQDFHNSLNPIGRWMLHNLLITFVESRLIPAAAGDIKASPFANAGMVVTPVKIDRSDVPRPSPMEQLSLLSFEQLLASEPYAWPQLFLFCDTEFGAESRWKAGKLVPGALEVWDRLLAYAKKIAAIFKAGGDDLIHGNCTTNFVENCQRYQEIMLPCFQMASSEAADPKYVLTLHHECTELKKILQFLLVLTNRYMPEDTLKGQLEYLSGQWIHLKMVHIREIFKHFYTDQQSSATDTTTTAATAATAAQQATIDAGPAMIVADHMPDGSDLVIHSIPPLLAKACSWLDFLEHSPLFDWNWTKHKNIVLFDEKNPTLPCNYLSQTLMVAARAWRILHNDITKGNITFGELETVVGYMKLEEEQGKGKENIDQIALLHMTNRDEGLTWRVHRLNAAAKSQVRNSRESLMLWLHLKAVHDALPKISRSLVHLAHFLLPESRGCVNDIENSIHEIATAISDDWPRFKLKEIESLIVHSKKVNPILIRLDDKLLETMVACSDLLQWLRTLPDDSNFTSSIEMAMGRSEMECPAELWEAGRPDEQKLSMLMTIRSFLHPYLYRKEQQFSDMNSLLACLGSIADPESKILDAMVVCNELRCPLEELLCCDSAQATINRLIQFQLPSWEAKWVCTGSIDSGSNNFSDKKNENLACNNNEADSLISLEYTVPRAGGTRTQKKQNLGEVLEFQSTIILAKSIRVPPTTQAAIDKFMGQIAWIRQLASTLVELRGSGHFSFLNFHYEVSLSQVSVEDLRKEAMRCKELLERWLADVYNKRREHYYLNFFGMNLTGKLYTAISSMEEEEEETGDGMSQYADFLGWVNPDAARDPSLVKRFEMLLKNNIENKIEMARCESEASAAAKKRNSIIISGDGDVEMQEVAALDDDKEDDECRIPGIDGGVNGVISTAVEAAMIIQACGKALGEALKDVPPRYRPIHVPAACTHAAGADILSPGVHVVVGDGPQSILDHILSAFCRAGYLPERQEVLLCSSNHTTWEDVNNLLLRWASAHKNNRQNRLYCLAGIDSLSFEFQRKAASEIHQLLKENVGDDMNRADSVRTIGNKNPLILISGSGEGVHLVAQFSHCRANVNALPVEVLKEMGVELQKKHSQGIQCYTSPQSGCGKTFAIRSEAAESGILYVRVPINNSSITPVELMDRISERLETERQHYREEHPINKMIDKFALHLDLSESLSSNLNPALFELSFMGGITDGASGRQWLWNPSCCRLDFEAAAGNLTLQRLHCLKLLPQVECIPGPATFKSTARELELGMGSKEFSSLRNDGTSTGVDPSKRNKQVAGASAFQRLQYTCAALDLQKRLRGKFPPEFKFDASQDKLVTGDRCYSLLVDWIVRPLDIKIDGPIADKKNAAAAAAAANSKNNNNNKNIVISLHSVWNFVNVLYWQLQDMHHANSPIHAVTMIDQSNQDSRKEEDVKLTLKGELVSFACKTAKSFATRITKTSTGPKITGLKIERSSRNQFNLIWKRNSFDVEGLPCFETADKSHHLFLYYRHSEGHWVIDDTIQQEGAVFSCCANSSLFSAWTSSSPWRAMTTLKVKKISHPDGYEGEAVEVSGAPPRGEVHDNGIYCRLPPLQDINGRAHYMMQKPYRRHLFYTHRWTIAPVCTEDEGAFALSVNEHLTANWMQPPQDVLETQMKITIVYDQDNHATTATTAAAAAAAAQQQQNDNNMQQFIEAGYDVGSDMLKWGDSKHECMLFSIHTHKLSFLSLDPQTTQSGMHPQLLRNLLQNGVDVGESTDKLNQRFHEILGALTGVVKSPEEAEMVMKGRYCLTGDALLKMLAIYVRVRCGIPVILMGECGCGKTFTISYICEWLGVRLITLDVHGGTTEQEILEIFAKAEEILAKKETRQVFVFLDEINTCPHMGLMTEAICRRSLNGRPISEGVRVLAALNPFRQRKLRSSPTETTGLVFQMHNGGSGHPKASPEEISMQSLVYRVHPVPKTLKDYVFDFGSLNDTTEELYILAMVRSFLGPMLTSNQNSPSQVAAECKLVATLISNCQKFIRKVDKEESSTSLRDVKRALLLTGWFVRNIVPNLGKDEQANPLPCAVLLALTHVYYYRLSSKDIRVDLLRFMARDVNAQGLSAWLALMSYKEMLTLLDKTQRYICDNVEVDEGIAMNAALMENLYTALVCILNRIPIFVVGKPGSSKTLAMQVIASNLQGKHSQKPFWRNFPAIYTFQYQCSPMSSSNSILSQYEIACRYQQHAHDSITVLLLDEVGLAEHSPEMPLKCLHGMLVDPPIAIVGLSNWVLDPAKMNRAVLLHRTEPSEQEIKLTGESIIVAAPGGHGNAEDSAKNKWLSSLATAYHKIYSRQKGRDFVGMRDYYHLVKLIASSCSDQGELDLQALVVALCRNFGGKPDELKEWVTTFCNTCFGNQKEWALPAVKGLITSNLKDERSRHLMVLTRGGVALPLMMGCGILDAKTTTVLIGSEFPDDVTELKLIQQINEVKLAMASGSTIVLLNHNNIYEALYDVLNQRYVNKVEENGRVRKMLRLAIGTRSQLCPVESTFKIVVIVDQVTAYNSLDLPLLNRFEKQVLMEGEILGPNMAKVTDELKQWAQEVLKSSGLPHYQALFCGYHPSAIASLVLSMSNFDDSKDVLQTFGKDLVHAKVALAKTATPISMMHSNLLSDLYGQQYFESHSCLSSALLHYVVGPSSSAGETVNLGAMAVVLTQSPTNHVSIAMDQGLEESLSHHASVSVCRLQLAELNSEQQLSENLKMFFQTGAISKKFSDHSSAKAAKRTTVTNQSCGQKHHSILLVQCDPFFCRESLINHARYVSVQVRSKVLDELAQRTREKHDGTDMDDSDDTLHYRRHVVFVVHLPPGLTQRSRFFPLDFHQPWQVVFIDDVRSVDSSIPGMAAAGSQLASHHQQQQSNDFSSHLSTELMLSMSLPSLILQGHVSIRKVLLKDWQSCICACSIPTLSDAEVSHTYGARIKLMGRLVQQERFLNVLECSALEVLKRHAVKVGKQEMHVSMVVTGDASGGSLRQSLVQALRSLVIQSIVCSLRNLDIDFNLALIEKYPDLWYAMAESKAVYDPCNAAISAKLTTKCSQAFSIMREAIVANSGTHGIMIAESPFHSRLVALLENRSTRDALQNVVNSPTFTPQHLTSVCCSILGEKVVQYWGNIPGYLQDYVVSSAPTFPNMSYQEQLAYYRLIVNVTSRDAGLTPAGIHSAIWRSEAILFCICSLCSNSAISKELQQEIMKAVKALECPSPSIFDKIPQVEVRIAAVLCPLLAIVIRDVLSGARASASFGTCNQLIPWVERVEAIAVDIEQLLLDLELKLGESDTSMTLPTWTKSVQGCSVKAVRDMWTAALIFKIVAQETLIPIRTFPASAATHLLFLLQNPKPLTFEFFQAIAMQLLVCSVKPVELSHFVRRYFDEIVFGGAVSKWRKNNGRASNDAAVAIEPNLLRAVVNIVCGHCEQLPPGALTLALRRSLLASIAPLEIQGPLHVMPSELLVSGGSAVRVESAVLLHDFWEDLSQYGSNNGQQQALTLEMTTNILNASFVNQIVPGGQLQVGQYLVALIAARSVIWAYCKKLSELCQIANKLEPSEYATNESYRTTHRQVRQMLDAADGALLKLLTANHDARVLALKCARMFAGVDLIADFIACPGELVPWLPIDRAHAARELAATSTIADPFLWLGDGALYRKLSGVLRAVATGSSQNWRDELKSLTVENRSSNSSSSTGAKAKKDAAAVASAGMVLGATFSQTVIEWDTIDKNHLGNIQSWLKEYSTANMGVFERPVAEWVANGSMLREEFHEMCIKHHGDSRGGRMVYLLQRQIAVHCAIRAIQHRHSMACAMLLNPSSQQNSFIPSMPNDDLAVVTKAMPELGWYKCPNGHVYAIANCTEPWVLGSCNVCGATIGGQKHVAATGNMRLGRSNEIDGAEMGYLASGTRGQASEDINRTNLLPISVRCLRLVIHSLLSVALSGPNTTVVNDAARLVLGKDKSPAPETAAATIAECLQEDWESLKHKTKLSDTDLAISIHMMISKIPLESCSVQFATPSAREQYEKQFQTAAVQPVFSADLVMTLEKIKEELFGSGRITAIRTQLGDSLWHEVHETPVTASIAQSPAKPRSRGGKKSKSKTHAAAASKKESSSTQQQQQQQHDPIVRNLWRGRVPTGWEQFVSCFHSRAENAANMPLLNVFINEEPKLHCIRAISSTLQWHKVLFTAFSTNPISREDASVITNAQVVEMLPEPQRDWGRQVLMQYCNDFNRSFVFVDPAGGFLHACTKNPFITDSLETPEVNLAGKTAVECQKMDETVPVIFSLPSKQPGADGEVDLRTICTIRLLECMSAVHNKLLFQVSRLTSEWKEKAVFKIQSTEPETAAKEATKSTKGGQKKAQNLKLMANDEVIPVASAAQVERARIEEQEEMAQSNGTVPVTTYMTSPELMRQTLIEYDRLSIFLPMLSTFSTQELEYGTGQHVSFDFARIEEELVRGIFAGLRPIDIHIRYFGFRGEAKGSSFLSTLDRKVPQEDLPATTKEAVIAEIDTVEKTTMLCSYIETSIAFLAAVGGASSTSINGEVLFKNFCIQTLLISPEHWEETATPSVSRIVRLKNIRSLFMLLEERTNGSRMNDVDPKYMQKLTPELETALNKASSKMDLGVLVPVLYDFITVSPGLLASNGAAIDPQLCLKEMMEYSTEAALGDWYEQQFPAELQIAHTFEVYKLLSSNK